MPKFRIEIRRSIVCTVEVEADNEDEAIHIASRADFPLPPRDEWEGIKDWSYDVLSDDDDEEDE